MRISVIREYAERRGWEVTVSVQLKLHVTISLAPFALNLPQRKKGCTSPRH
jgi:hypothetical protein